MVDSCFTTSVFCICSAMIAVVLRQYSREQSMLAALAACAGVLASALLFLGQVIEGIGDMFSSAGVSEEYIAVMFKAAAIAVITEIACELCRDSGEGAIASAAEIFGRSALTLMALPLVRALMDMISVLLQEEV